MPDMKSTIEHFEVAFDWSEAELSGRILPREGVDSDFDAASSVISEVESKLDAYLEEQREHFGNSSEVVFFILMSLAFSFLLLLNLCVPAVLTVLS